MKKLYVIRKYIWAETLVEAIGKDSDTVVEDAWLDDDWKKNAHEARDSIGFQVEQENDDN